MDHGAHKGHRFTPCDIRPINRNALPVRRKANRSHHTFTVGLVYGIDEYGYEGRYCYAHEDALKCLVALKEWDGTGHPSGPWIKHKAHGIDEHNPVRIFVKPEPA